MKNILLAGMIILTINIGYGQKYIDDIAEATCDCIAELPDSLDGEEFTGKLGLCMIGACQPYAKKIKKDFNIDINDPYGNGRVIGEMVGKKMAFVCPDLIIKNSSRGKKKEKETGALLSFEGLIIDIEEGDFVIFSIEDENGKVMKFHWLGLVENEVDLVDDYKRLEFASVKVSYTNEEFFSPEYGEYLTSRVLKEMIWAE